MAVSGKGSKRHQLIFCRLWQRTRLPHVALLYCVASLQIFNLRDSYFSNSNFKIIVSLSYPAACWGLLHVICCALRATIKSFKCNKIPIIKLSLQQHQQQLLPSPLLGFCLNEAVKPTNFLARSLCMLHASGNFQQCHFFGGFAFKQFLIWLMQCGEAGWVDRTLCYIQSSCHKHWFDFVSVYLCVYVCMCVCVCVRACRFLLLCPFPVCPSSNAH